MATRSLATQTRSIPSLIEDILTPFMQLPISSFFGDGGRTLSVPAANIVEGKDNYKIRLAVPGMKREDFKIDLENNQLRISAETEEKMEQEEDQITRQEYSFSSFSRAFALPEDVNKDKIQARYENGVLTITLVKKDEAVRGAISKHINVS